MTLAISQVQTFCWSTLLRECDEAGALSRVAKERVYREIAQPVIRTALAVTGDHAQAEDILHDVYLKILANHNQWERRSDFKTWLYRLTFNECLSLKRRLKTVLKYSSVLQKSERPAETGYSLEDAVFIRDFFKTLNAEERIVIQLKYIEELTFEEIAVALNKPVGTVKSLASRALKKGERHGTQT